MSTITAAALGAAGCMTSPTDDGRVPSTTAAVPFQGYVPSSNVPVQVRAWDYAANAMASVGLPVRSGTTPVNLSDGSLYLWEAPRVLPPRFWRPGPAGGHCAAVGAQTTIGGQTYDVMTVERSWGRCFNEHPTIYGFAAHCESDNSPFALIYTSDWRAITVDQSRLDLAGRVASREVTLTLDNYTPNQGEFCNADNPAGCPPGLSADPETYQFYAPNASSLTRDGQPPLTFSITPSRSDPMTIYIDDLSSTSLDFTTSGSQLVLGINFESGGPEIRMNCIRDFWCGALGNPTVELGSPRAEIGFTLEVRDGRVGYTGATARFTTSSTDSRALQIANGIAAAMTDKVNHDPGIRNALEGALDAMLRQTSFLGALPLAGVTVGGGTVQVLPGCPLD